MRSGRRRVGWLVNRRDLQRDNLAMADGVAGSGEGLACQPDLGWRVERSGGDQREHLAVVDRVQIEVLGVHFLVPRNQDALKVGPPRRGEHAKGGDEHVAARIKRARVGLGSTPWGGHRGLPEAVRERVAWATWPNVAGVALVALDSLRAGRAGVALRALR